MMLDDKETRAVLPAVYAEVCSLTRCQRHKELTEEGVIKLDSLRSILKRMMAETGWVLSQEERQYAGLDS